MVGCRWLLVAGKIAFSILSENFLRPPCLLFEVAISSIQLYCKCGLRFALALSIALETDETCKQKSHRPIVIISDILCTKVIKVADVKSEVM